jgi:nucleoside-diphosphate-sugar epimerase
MRELHMSGKRVLVPGAAGFTGHHYCRYLTGEGDWNRGADQQPTRAPILAK